MIYQITGKDLLRLSHLPDPDGELANLDLRLAMLSRGEDPANWSRVVEINDLDYETDFLDYLDPLLEQMADRTEPEYHDGQATVQLRHPAQGGAEQVAVRSLKGRDRRLLNEGSNSVEAHQGMMARMCGLSDDQVRGCGSAITRP